MSMSDLPEDLDPRISGALEKLSAEFQQRLAETRTEITRMMAAAAEAAAAVPEPAADEVAGAAAAPGLDALEEVKQAITQIDKGTTQAEILSALVAGAGRFASRSALFLVRPDGLNCWGSHGLEGGARAPEGLAIDGAPDSPWKRISTGEGGFALDAADCGALCEPLGLEAPKVGLLLPFILGDQVAAALYADRVEGDGSLDVSALQLLTFSAGQVLETLPVRRREATATLRLAEAASAVEEEIEPEPPSEVEEPGYGASSSAGLYAAGVEALPQAAEPSIAGDLPEIEDLPDVEELPEVVLPKAEFFEESPREAEPEVDEITESIDPAPGFEMEQAAAEYGLEESGPEEAELAGGEPGEELGADFELSDRESADTVVEEPVPAADLLQTPPMEKISEPAPPPPVPDLSGGSSSTQVAPPEDVQGPGWAFTTTRISPEVGEEAQHEEARRLARLLVTEIKLYNEEQVQEGRLAKNVYARLKEDIDRSQQIYDERIGESVRSQGQYFREALVRILCGGDESALGA